MPVSKLAEIFDVHEPELLAEWLRLQVETGVVRSGKLPETQLRNEARTFVAAMKDGSSSGNVTDVSRPEWARVREVLSELSRNRAVQGFSPSETANFVLSFKEPLFNRLRSELGSDAHVLAEEVWAATLLLDRLALFTTEVFQKSREQLITRQQQEMLELSTPVVQLWQGILALPLIGTLDSARTQVVMQNLLEAIVARGAAIAIIDITGVPTVDTLVAQHLLKTVAAARLMGADCIISGIRPQIAQTIIHLGVELGAVTTKATLSDALQIALRRAGLTVTKA